VAINKDYLLLEAERQQQNGRRLIA